MEADGLPAAAAAAAAAAPGGNVSAFASPEGLAIRELYAWLDTLPLSRPKRSLHRDFADGVLMAEVANHCVPRIAELHNYSTANSFQQKRYNWQTLSERVFKRVGLRLTAREIESVVAAKPGAIENVILKFRRRAEVLKQQGSKEFEEPPTGLRSTCRSGASPPRPANPQEWASLLAERDNTIKELEEKIAILNAKADSLQKLLQLRDAKIELLTKALEASATPLNPKP